MSLFYYKKFAMLTSLQALLLHLEERKEIQRVDEKKIKR